MKIILAVLLIALMACNDDIGLSIDPRRDTTGFQLIDASANQPQHPCHDSLQCSEWSFGDKQMVGFCADSTCERNIKDGAIIYDEYGRARKIRESGRWLNVVDPLGLLNAADTRKVSAPDFHTVDKPLANSSSIFIWTADTIVNSIIGTGGAAVVTSVGIDTSHWESAGGKFEYSLQVTNTIQSAASPAPSFLRIDTIPGKVEYITEDAINWDDATRYDSVTSTTEQGPQCNMGKGAVCATIHYRTVEQSTPFALHTRRGKIIDLTKFYRFIPKITL